MNQLYQPLLITHSLLRYVVLLLLLFVIFNSLAGWLGKKNFTGKDEKLALFTLISAHTQLLLGLILYAISPYVQFHSGFMKVSGTRYWTVEHITMMVIAIVLITIGKSSLKRLTTSESKFKRLSIMNILALVIIIAAIIMAKRGFFFVTGL